MCIVQSKFACLIFNKDFQKMQKKNICFAIFLIVQNCKSIIPTLFYFLESQFYALRGRVIKRTLKGKIVGSDRPEQTDTGNGISWTFTKHRNIHSFKYLPSQQYYCLHCIVPCYFLMIFCLSKIIEIHISTGFFITK